MRVGLPHTLREELRKLLKESIDVFAWQFYDITGIRKKLIKHKLNNKVGNKAIRH